MRKLCFLFPISFLQFHVIRWRNFLNKKKMSIVWMCTCRYACGCVCKPVWWWNGKQRKSNLRKWISFHVFLLYRRWKLLHVFFKFLFECYVFIANLRILIYVLHHSHERTRFQSSNKIHSILINFRTLNFPNVFHFYWILSLNLSLLI